MNISEGQEIAGLSALKIRELFRKCGGIYLGINEAMYYLGIGPRNAKKLLIQLEKEGYLEHRANPRPYGDSWELTPKGAGLRMASAAPPIKRATADRLLSQVLKRVDEINSSPDFLYTIIEVILFGSYLDESKMALGDLDLTIKMERRESDFHKFLQMNLDLADKDGRYDSFFFRSNYGRYKVYKYLRNRSRGISLHDGEDKILKTGIPTKIVYPYEKPKGS